MCIRDSVKSLDLLSYKPVIYAANVSEDDAAGEDNEYTVSYTHLDAYDAFREVIQAGCDMADLIVVETMTDRYEVKAAVLAAKETCDLPVMVTMTFEENGRTFTGVSLEAMALTLEGLGVDAMGINCSLGPVEIFPMAEKLRSLTTLPVVVKPVSYTHLDVYKRQTPSCIINTHTHIDHLGGNEYLMKKYGIPAYCTDYDMVFAHYSELEAAYMNGGYPAAKLRKIFAHPGMIGFRSIEKEKMCIRDRTEHAVGRACPSSEACM